MCVTGESATPAAALAMLESALDGLNGADMASLPAASQAECLRVLERAGADEDRIDPVAPRDPPVRELDERHRLGRGHLAELVDAGVAEVADPGHRRGRRWGGGLGEAAGRSSGGAPGAGGGDGVGFVGAGDLRVE